MQTMRAIRIRHFGGLEALTMQEVPVPAPGDGEVLLKVRAASVNPVDYKIRSGNYPAVKGDKLPYILGRDVSGEVEARGPGANAFAEGEAIYGTPGIDRGGYAEYVVLRESEAARKPSTIDDVAAAAVPLAGLTAWQGLFRHGRLAKGQRVLIHGGSGGVGHFAVQFAKARGAYVIATASGEHLDFVRRLGADEVIDYKQTRFEEKVRDVDLVFDLIGGETQDRSWQVIRRGGALVSTLNEPSREKAAELGIRALRYTVEESGADLAEITRLIEDGKVTPEVSRTFPLQAVEEAQRSVEEGHTQGKVVLVVV